MQKDKGFTLIELVITLGMISLIIAAAYSFYLTSLNSWQHSVDHMEYQQNARIALDKIIRELQYASEVQTRSGGRELRFKVPGDSRTFRFRLFRPQLIYDAYLTQFYTVVALNITNLHFRITESGLVEIEIGAGEGTEDIVTLRSSVRPRNLP
ncbi:MAG: prepilin-type N-terminal cleavage/methylation domain-containing protein [Bacillota bacterium]|nr:prepilin-type N-terminal cleavage/methylation domain-containing protein [Bacillota bacterium]